MYILCIYTCNINICKSFLCHRHKTIYTQEWCNIYNTPLIGNDGIQEVDLSCN